MANDIFSIAQSHNAPDQHGVYALYEGAEIIYIGRAKGTGVTICSRLQSHRSGYDGVCTQRATDYWFETCANPESREIELLNWHRTKFGRLPRCNERVG